MKDDVWERKRFHAPNPAVICGDVAFMVLHGGYVATLDLQDYLAVRQFRWHLSDNAERGYVRTCFRGAKVWLHHVVLWLAGVEFKEQVDHRNRNHLDNRRTNLRGASPRQNMANIGTRRGRAFKGVFWEPHIGKWRARVGGKHIGVYADQEVAARAYDEAALKLHGEFARLNIPQDRLYG